ncbi:MAG: site-specific integrase [Bacteroidales bacterium]|nr:site-specific integrase [Bacteroidales bacterium]
MMDRFSLAGITVSVIFDTRRTKEDLTFPVKYRVTYNRKQVYYPSGIDLTENQWQIIGTTKNKELVDLRELIQIGFDKVKAHIKEMTREEGFSFQGLNNRLKQGKQNSVLSEFYSKIDRLEEEGRPGTASAYRCAINSIQKFTSLNLKFADISPEWLRKYERHMIEEGRSMATVGIYMRAIRAIINENKTFITPAQYPFGRGKYEIKKGSGRKMALTLSQINEILKLDLPTEEARKYRSLWYFSFLTNGININDMLRLKYSNIENGEILFLRGKTVRTNPNQKEIRATILPEMKTIIKKWGNHDRNPDNYIFPFLTNSMTPVQIRVRVQDVTRRINRRMKTIGETLGYGSISTYNARHSYASILKHHHVDLAFISESLGHSDLKTTEAYLSSFDNVERAKVASILTNNK